MCINIYNDGMNEIVFNEILFFAGLEPWDVIVAVDFIRPYIERAMSDFPGLVA